MGTMKIFQIIIKFCIQLSFSFLKKNCSVSASTVYNPFSVASARNKFSIIKWSKGGIINNLRSRRRLRCKLSSFWSDYYVESLQLMERLIKFSLKSAVLYKSEHALDWKSRMNQRRIWDTIIFENLVSLNDAFNKKLLLAKQKR